MFGFKVIYDEAFTMLDVLKLSPLIFGAGFIGAVIGHKLTKKMQKVNVNCIDGDCSKVCTAVDVEDIGDKKAFCRCWRSSKFPYCDGSHTAHNAATGDNVGPLIVSGKK